MPDELMAISSFLNVPAGIANASPRVVGPRPRTVLLSATLTAIALLLGTGAGLYGYAIHQWDAARTALKEERPAEARERLGFCLSVWPRSPEVHLLAARAARLVGDLNAAEAHLNQCLKIQGGATEPVQLEFLLLRVQAGEVDELAPALIETVQNGHPEAPLILETLARAYILRLRYKPAYACLTRWIELYPETAKAYQWRGWVLERVDNHNAATEDYHRALELDPDLVPVRLRVAEMLLEDHQPPKALPHLERLYQQVPDNPQVQARLGMCRYLQGQTEEALRLMEAAVVHLPKDPALLVHLGKLHLDERRGAEAERWLRRVLEVEPSDTEALYVLISALRLQGKAEEADAVLEEYKRARALVDRTNELLSKVADSPTATADDYAEIGKMLLQIGRRALGEYWLNQALQREPGHREALEALADHYETLGNHELADAHRRRIPRPGGKTPGP